jgi:hypothetical protein
MVGDLRVEVSFLTRGGPRGLFRPAPAMSPAMLSFALPLSALAMKPGITSYLGSAASGIAVDTSIKRENIASASGVDAPTAEPLKLPV